MPSRRWFRIFALVVAALVAIAMRARAQVEAPAHTSVSAIAIDALL